MPDLQTGSTETTSGRPELTAEILRKIAPDDPLDKPLYFLGAERARKAFVMTVNEGSTHYVGCGKPNGPHEHAEPEHGDGADSKHSPEIDAGHPCARCEVLHGDHRGIDHPFELRATTGPAAVFAAAAETLAAFDGAIAPYTTPDMFKPGWAPRLREALSLSVNSAPAALDLGRASVEMGQVFARINGVWTGWDDDADEVVERFRAALDKFLNVLQSVL